MTKLRASLAMTFWAIFLSAFFISSALAMDADLWQLPQLPEATVVWKDQPMEVNQIKANATHLRTALSEDKIISFYKNALEGQGWKYDKKLTPDISAFIKKDRFIYIGIIPAKENHPRDVYLIASPASLAICENLKDYFLKERIAPDVQGKDFADVPRYPGSRRRIDVLFPQQAGYLIYETDAAPRDIARFFRQEMPRSGWKEERALSAEVMQKLNPMLKDMQILLFHRGDNTVLFNITVTPKNFPDEAKALGRTLIIITRNMQREIAFPKREVK
ncbi:MAG: hypothetical protein NTU54_08190 [Candidatus Omnitrophica bacterium]|nr:hypothetical protein [Candidatus Omnitrophota bacterium]